MGAYVQWNDDKHSTGIEGIDDQHKVLFLLANQLHTLTQADPNPQQVSNIFKRLHAYTNYHFATEESVFLRYSYPNAEDHRKKHLALTGRVRAFSEEFRQRHSIDLKEVLDFLVDWILDHIQGDDRAYAVYFRAHDIQVHIHFSPVPGKEAESGSEALKLWTEKNLQLEIEGLDSQHKELVFILQQANDLNLASSRRKQVFLPGIIKKLFFYAQYHFAYEEELMSKEGYPRLAEHRELHSGFVERVGDFSRSHADNTDRVNDEIVIFLKNWIVNHILKEDTRYKQFVAR